MAFPNHEPHQYYSSQYPQYPQYPQEKHSDHPLQDFYGYSQQHSAQQFPQHSAPAQFPQYSGPQFPQESAPQFPQHSAPQFPQPSVTHYEQHALPHPHPQYPGDTSYYPPQTSSCYPSQNGSDPFIKLSFSNRTMVNTSIILNGAPCYKISTADIAGAITNIKDARTCALISTIQRRTLHPDSVTFARRYDGKTFKVKEWLVKSIEGTKWTIQAGGITLTFLWDISNRLLVYQDSNFKEAVAWFDPATPAESFSFFIKNGMENIWDLTLTAIIYIVHKRLVTDKFFSVNDATSSQQAQWLVFHQMAN